MVAPELKQARTDQESSLIRHSEGDNTNEQGFLDGDFGELPFQ
jgi:hypothetical protein